MIPIRTAPYRRDHSRPDRARPGLAGAPAREPGDPVRADGMERALRAVRADIHLASRIEYNLAIGKWDLAADISRYLARKYPDHPQWWIHWANALKEMSRFREARRVAREGLKRHPDSTALHFNLACYDALAGRLGAARRRLARVFRKHPALLDHSLKDPDLAGMRNWCRTIAV